MSVTTVLEFTVADLSLYKNYQSRSCRDVLLQNIHDVSYAGDLRSFVTEADVLARVRQVNIKILRLLDHLAALKSVRTSFSPTARLPCEILLQIFALCTNRHTEMRRKHWLAFSQVCSRWRQLALSHASLWTHLDSDADEQLAHLMSARSNTLSVSITPHNVQCLMRLAPPPARVRSLALALDQRPLPWDAALIDKYLSAQFPEMESLFLAAGALAGPARYDLQALEAPRLQEVKLQNCLLRDWEVPFLARLRHLELTFPDLVHSTDIRSLPSLTALLAMLARNPGLASLALHEAYHLYSDRGPEPRTERVVLPHLTKLRISDSISRVGTLLELLVLPEVKDVCVIFEADVGVVTQAQVQALLNVLDGVIQNEAWTTLYCGVDLHSSDTTVIVSNDLGSPRESATRASSRLELVYREHSSRKSLAFLNTFVAVLPRTKVTTLDAHLTQPGSDIILNQYFWNAVSLFPALTTVTVGTVHADRELMAVRGLINVLSLGISVHDGRVDPTKAIPTWFSALQDLTFSCLNFKDMYDTTKGEIAFTMLEAFVEQSETQSKPVRVVLRDCLFTNLERGKLEARPGRFFVVNSDLA